MMYAWSLFLIAVSIAMMTANSGTSADAIRGVTIELNLNGRTLAPEQLSALQQAIINALNRRRQSSTTTSVPVTTMTTAVVPGPQKKRKRNALWVTKPFHYGNGIDDDVSFVDLPSELDNGVFRISEILNTEDSKLSLGLLMDSMRDMDRTGELQKAIGSPITLVNVNRGLPKVPKPENTQLHRIRRGVSRLREILGI